MMRMDENLLVHAHREDAPNHDAWNTWVEDVIPAGPLTAGRISPQRVLPNVA